MINIKVLSIDFDYFQNVDKDTVRHCYPDGIDLPTNVSTVVWSTHYANKHTEEKLKNVSIMKDELKLLYSLFEKQDSNIPVLITNSHINIYEFIKEQMAINKQDKVFVSNIDMHHDFSNENKNIDCGNWLGYMSREIGDKFAFQWIANPVAKSIYGFDDKDDVELYKNLNKYIKTSIADLKVDKYDAIFLCRSDNWFAPHLDDYFLETVCEMRYIFNNIVTEKDCYLPRDYISLVNQQRQFFERTQKDIKDSEK